MSTAVQQVNQTEVLRQALSQWQEPQPTMYKTIKNLPYSSLYHQT